MSVAMEAGNSEVGVFLYAHEERHKSASVSNTLLSFTVFLLPATVNLL